MIPDIKNPNPSSESLIIEILSQKPRLTAKDLYEYFLAKYIHQLSVQGFYKILRKLLEQRIIVKENKLLSLDASWIYNLINFSNLLQKNYFGSQSNSINILLNEGESKNFNFDSVMEMDNFWTHALIIVTQYYSLEKHTDKNAYVYLDHSWFQLIKTNQEKSLNYAYKQNNMQVFHLNRCGTFLDKLGLMQMDDPNYHWEVENLPEQNQYQMCIGDYIFETKMPLIFFEELGKIYKNVTSLDQFLPKKLIGMASEKVKTILTITRSKTKAEELRLNVKGHFKK